MVHLVRNSEGKIVGWEMKPTTQEEHEIVAAIRDLQFFGLDDTKIVYNGITFIDEEKGKKLGNIKSISWVQKKEENL